jgi:signal transduction histidine kinase
MTQDERLRVAQSLRAKFLLVILFGVVVPLAIVGFWMARATERSGRALLRARLDSSLVLVVNQVSARWLVVRSGLLDIAEAPTVRSALNADTSDSSRRTASLPATVTHAWSGAGESGGPMNLVLRGPDSVARWTVTRTNDSALRLDPSVDAPTRVTGILVSLAVISRQTGARLGSIETQIPAGTLVPVGAGGTGGIGAVLGVADRASGAWLVPLPFDPGLLAADEFEWAGDRWLVARRVLEEPRLLLTAAAPLSGYSAPFEQAARNGALALLLVSIATLVLAAVLTGRLTQSLQRLAVAADAVSRGDLAHQVDAPADDEVGRVARAFNGMIRSLRNTLDELARRERLAAVGEFAASLAHEVRNPLTSLRMDLQRMEEQVPPESTLRAPLDRALRVVTRLNDTVSGALRVARSGRAGSELMNLRVPLKRALEVTAPAIEQAGAVLEVPDVGEAPLMVRGDPDALEQLFLNLLLNAVQALEAGGRIAVSLTDDRYSVEVCIRDTGHGIPAALLRRVFDPFVSTKPEGTGLGLAIARQIAIAHGGDLRIASEEEVGSTVTLRLPLAVHAPDSAQRETRLS